MAKKRINPRANYVLSRHTRWRMRSITHVELRALGEQITLPLEWYVIVNELAQPSTIARACDAFGVSLAAHPDLARAFEHMLDYGIVLEEGEIEADEESIVSVLAPHVLGDRSNRKKIGAALRAGRLVVIPNAFRAPRARAMYDSLSSATNWQPYERFLSHFFYDHHNLYDPMQWPSAMLRMKSVFGSQATRELMSELTQQDCSADPAFSASRYMPFDHSLPHNDLGDCRAVSFVWHLTKDWDPSWGGGFYWCQTGTMVAPSFNTFVLFVVSEETKHMVCKVAPHARGQRLTLNGWWRGQPSARHAKVERKKDRDMSTSSAVQPGTFGQRMKTARGGRVLIV